MYSDKNYNLKSYNLKNYDLIKTMIKRMKAFELIYEEKAKSTRFSPVCSLSSSMLSTKRDLMLDLHRFLRNIS